MHRDKLTAGTVKSYLSSVHFTQISLGLGDPHAASMPQLEYVIKGVKRKAAANSSHLRILITVPVMANLLEVWQQEPNVFDASMLWAVTCTCFFEFLWVDEVVVPSDNEYNKTIHLSVDDMIIDNTVSPQCLEIWIKASKIDPFHKGVSVFVGITGKEVRPVSAILNYRVQQGSQPGPFFYFSDGQLLTRQRFVVCVR